MSNGTISTFSIGGVLVRGLLVLRRNLALFGTLSAIFMSPPFVIGLMLKTGSGRVAIQTELQTQIVSQIIEMVALILLWFLLWILLYFLLFATLTHGTICDLRGTPARIGNSLKWSLGRLLPVIGFTIVAIVAIVLTMIVNMLIVALVNLFSGFNIVTIGMGVVPNFLIVFLPAIVVGLILFTRWWIAVAIVVVERPGVLRSLRRSAELTSGYRWRVFGTLIVILIAQNVLDRAAGVILSGAPSVLIVVSFVISAAATAYIAVVSAVCYHDLRVLKDGVDVDEIARVFE